MPESPSRSWTLTDAAIEGAARALYEDQAGLSFRRWYPWNSNTNRQENEDRYRDMAEVVLLAALESGHLVPASLVAEAKREGIRECVGARREKSLAVPAKSLDRAADFLAGGFGLE